MIEKEIEEMRRWLLLFLCAVLSISTAHRLFAQEATLRVLDGAGDPGSEENPVFVELTNASQVSIVQFALNFDGTLLSVAGVQPTGRTEHMGTFSWVVLDSGAVVVHIEDLTGEVIDPGVGPVVTFFFDVAEEGLGGEVPLHLPEEGARLFGPASDSISVRVIDGTFRVTVPDISLSAYSHNYGYILMDHSEAWELTIYNGGTGVLTILEVTSDNFEFSVTSPSFPQDVAPDDSLKVVVTFSPSLEGPRSASVSISSNDPDEGLISLSLTGGGTSVDIELSATDHDFNTVRVGSSSDWPVAIYNLGVDDLTVFDIVSDHSDFGVAYPSFPQIVSPAGSLEVILRFQPASMGTLTATLTLTCDDPDEGTILLGVTGVGVAPDIQLSAISHDFGDVEVGTSEGWLLTLFNVGTVDLTVSTVSSDNEDFTVTFPPFPQTIQPGGDLEVIISFVPSNVGERAASLTISSDDPFDSTLVISLNGRGVPSATLHVGQGSGAPGSTGNPVPLLLTNRTSVMALRCILTYNASKLQISNVSPTVRTDRMGIFTWSEPLAGKVVLLIEDLTGREIMPGAGPVANLLFDVASPVFPTEEPLTLSNVALYDPDGEDIFTLFDEPGSFTIIAPEITLSATSHTFGSVVLGNSVTWTLEILNDGTVDLAVTGVTSTHSDFSVLTPSFPQTVAPGGSLEVAVRFTPTSLGPVAGAITVVSDDPDEGLLSVPVTGEGVVPHIELSAYSHNYGEVVLETPSSWSMKVYNTGTADLVVTRVTVDRADFAVTSPPFPQTVEASDSLTVAVGFSPSSLGTITGTLTIFSNDPEQGELSVFLTGVGIAPEIDVPESSHNFGEVVVGGMSSWVMRVFNIGTADLILHNITSDRVDFSVVAPPFPQTIPPDGFIDVMISFSPTVQGLILGRLTIASNDVDESSFFIPVEGSGIAADIHLSAVSHDFGSVLLNTSRLWRFKIFNLGVVLLEVSEVTTGTSDFVITSPTFPQSILPGDTIEVSVSFRPQVLDIVMDTIGVVSNDPDEGVLALPVQGTGVAPHIVLSAEGYNFGGVIVGRSVSWTLVVRNAGTYDLNIGRISLADSTEFGMSGVTSPDTLAPSDSLNILFVFKPKSPGFKTDTLTIETNDLNQPTVTFTLAGQGSAPPELSVFDRRGQPGSSGHLVPLNLVNEMAVSKMVFTLQYDATRLVASDVQPTVRTDSMGTFTWREPNPGQIEVTIDDDGEEVIQAGNGWIVEFFFDVKTDAPIGEAPLTLTDVSLFDIEGRTLPKHFRGGSFEVVQDLRQVTIAISHRSRPAGDTFSVPIKLLEDITGLEVWAIEFTVLFDTLLTATIVSDRGTVADLWRETPNAFYSFQTGIFKDRVMVAIAASFSLWGDGTFANITFEVSPDAQSGTTSPLHFENFRVNEGEPPAEFIDGWFSVASVPDIDFSLRAHDFDSVAVGESESWQLTVYNVGTEDLVVDSLVSTLSDFTFSEETLPRTVSSDGHFDVVVYFSPSRLGEIAGLMRFVSNDPDEATAIISLKGIGAHEVGVELASFAGLWTGREVLLQWSVGAMADLLGFQVYRRGEGETEYRRLTPHPLMGADKFIFRDEEVPGPGSYFYRLGAVETNGQEEFVGTVTVKVPDPDLSFSLSQNYPNPFNPTTTLCYTIPSREQGAESEGRGEDSELYALRATLKIFNLLGQEVRTLVDEVKEAGHYTVTWDGRDYQGDEVPSGVYFYRLEADGFSETRSMLLLR